MTGMRFNQLTVLERDYSKKNRVYWFCLCDCGKNTSVASSQLKSGKTKSCGCLKNESIIKSNNRKKRSNDFDLQSYDYGIIHFEKSLEKILFDKEDYDDIKQYCWRIDKNGYVVTSVYNEKTNRYNRLLQLHRFLMKCPNGFVVDHINGNKLDNRKENLRICTQSDNTKNHILSSNNTTGVSGVRWNKINRNWRVFIGNKSIGSFKTFDDAVKARKEAEEKYFGEYSYDNSRKR